MTRALGMHMTPPRIHIYVLDDSDMTPSHTSAPPTSDTHPCAADPETRLECMYA